MIAAVDVHYDDALAAAACVTFDDWPAPRATRELARLIPKPAPYVPGEFYRRELPAILAVLAALGAPPAVVVIDGYVWLDAAGRPGLGAQLFEALHGAVAVAGVAKTAFDGSPHAERVLRGTSRRPLYVTAQGLPVLAAAAGVRQMHGAHRIPTLLGRVDRLCREALARGAAGRPPADQV